MKTMQNDRPLRVLLWIGCAVLALAHTIAGADLPSVKILATGGTIAGIGPAAIEAGYQPSELPVEDIINAVPEIHEIAKISGEQVIQISSQNITPDIWLKIAKQVNEALDADDIDGIVITHGTDTMEETAYLLNLTVSSDKPVVLVGALRPFTALSADGAMNLYNAVAIAASPKARGKGVLLSLNETILAARDVTKAHTTNPATFQARETGPLGSVFFGDVTFYTQPIRAHTTQSEFNIDEVEVLPRVDIIYGYAGDNSELVNAAVEAGAKGIVYAGVGNGNFNPNVEKALAEARKKDVVVVRSSRVGSGRVTLGAEVDDAKYGFVVADDLDPQKARVLLTLALTKTNEPQQIQEMFFKY